MCSLGEEISRENTKTKDTIVILDTREKLFLNRIDTVSGTKFSK